MSSFSHSSQALLVSFVLCTCSILFACSGDGGSAAADAGSVTADAGEQPTFTVGGTVTGLTGELNLVLNGTELVAVSADGALTFATKLQDNESYLVTVLVQPSGQSCSLVNASGTIAGANVSDLSVNCVAVSADLTSLEFLDVDAPLSPAFDAEQSFYAASISFLISGVTLVPTAVDASATILVNGVAVASGSPSTPIALDLGVSNAIIEVTASNGDSRIYLVEINRGGDVLEQIAYGKASTTDTGDQFGFSVALSGDTLAVGASGEASNVIGVNGDQANNSASGSGAVYVFRRSGTTWAQEAYLKASNTDADDQFGFSVALSGDTLAVGASGEASNVTDVNGDQADNSAVVSGAVYVFRRSGTTWAQEAYLKASNTGASDEFGTSVALSGDTLAVGAPRESSNATGVNGDQADNSVGRSGAVYVFRRSGTTWAQEAYLKASNTGLDDRFGTSVALSGDTLAVGAPRESSNATGVNGDQDDNSASRSGAVYVFRRSGTTWAQEAYLKASNTDIGDLFGSVTLSGDTLAIGARRESSNAIGVNGNQADNSASLSGAVYVFRRSGTMWAQEAYIKAPYTGASDFFGLSVALSGDTLAVAAQFESSNAIGVNGDPADNSASNAGAAYVFHRSGMTWALEAYIKASNTDVDDRFGFSVALSDDTLAVGAYFEDSNATDVNGDQANNLAANSGAVYLFQ